MLELVRTEGKRFTSGQTLDPAAFLQLPDLSRGSKTQVTRDAERELQLGDCLYFYAGHACPAFGDVVLIYDAEMADQDAGSATPFDTGGLRLGHVRHNSPDSALEYCRRHATDLPQWRAAAKRYVQTHFDPEADYALGRRPAEDDTTGRLLHPENERRAWTWEVRVHRDHALERDLRRVWMSVDYHEAVRQALLGGTTTTVDRCRNLLASKTVQKATAGVSPHAEAEKEIAHWP